MKSNGANALILAFAKKKAGEKRLGGSDDCKAVAKDILAAVKSGDEKALAEALRAFREVDKGDGDE